MLSVQEDSQQWEGKPRGRMVPGGQWSIPWDVQGTGRGAGGVTLCVWSGGCSLNSVLSLLGMSHGGPLPWMWLPGTVSIPCSRDNGDSVHPL